MALYFTFRTSLWICVLIVSSRLLVAEPTVDPPIVGAEPVHSNMEESNMTDPITALNETVEAETTSTPSTTSTSIPTKPKSTSIPATTTTTSIPTTTTSKPMPAEPTIATPATASADTTTTPPASTTKTTSTSISTTPFATSPVAPIKKNPTTDPELLGPTGNTGTRSNVAEILKDAGEPSVTSQEIDDTEVDGDVDLDGNEGDNPQDKDPDQTKSAKVDLKDDAGGSTQFMGYFITAVVLVFVGYIAYHNRAKLFALVLEGRNQHKRRHQGKTYKPVKSTVEEVINAGTDKLHQVIY